MPLALGKLSRLASEIFLSNLREGLLSGYGPWFVASGLVSANSIIFRVSFSVTSLRKLFIFGSSRTGCSAPVDRLALFNARSSKSSRRLHDRVAVAAEIIRAPLVGDDEKKINSLVHAPVLSWESFITTAR
jgi:hypothetical protein